MKSLMRRVMVMQEMNWMRPQAEDIQRAKVADKIEQFGKLH